MLVSIMLAFEGDGLPTESDKREGCALCDSAGAMSFGLRSQLSKHAVLPLRAMLRRNLSLMGLLRFAGSYSRSENLRNGSLSLNMPLGSSLMDVVYEILPGTPIVEGGNHTAEHARGENCVFGFEQVMSTTRTL